MMKTVPEEEFVDKLQVRPSSLQGWLILFWVKFSALHSTSLKCYRLGHQQQNQQHLYISEAHRRVVCWRKGSEEVDGEHVNNLKEVNCLI